MKRSDRVVYRRATARDAVPLCELAARTFRATYADAITSLDLEVHVVATFHPDIQLAEITADGSATFLAETGGALVGYAQLRSRAPESNDVGRNPIELHRIYVDKGWQGAGIGKRLMQHAEEEARRNGADTLWLGVWEANTNAVAFYTGIGFREVGSHTFVVGTDHQRDLILARAIPA